MEPFPFEDGSGRLSISSRECEPGAIENPSRPDGIAVWIPDSEVCMRLQLLVCLSVLFSSLAVAAEPALHLPRRHDRPPGEPLSPDEAVRRMTVPVGFTVELVAAEPDLVNPVAMCIDERGRYWVTESLEYPRREPGPGQDRVKILEDTDGDGKVDKVTTFAEGLNIPSGIAVGYGGVWVCNAPDLLYLQDTDGDGKADKTEVIITGLGRTDTHELPNSLTWGPDGWLYGLNGVFNYCKVTYPPTSPHYKKDQKSIDFTCAIFRVHPRTKKFEIFSEGTSNPWGIAINDEGEFFLSACVIDHLWHFVESGYYIRQGGPYPPHTWPMRSIVNHKHQKAAYCGIQWFDSDAYPEEYRNVLFMGNIHGGCINADVVSRSGSTYAGQPHPGFPAKPGAWDDDTYGLIRKTGDAENPRLADFLSANDAWFMPVAQKIGPDGSLYVLDWYDRYHCYQDANADPGGVERAKGRLYRVRYQQTPHAKPFELNQKSDDELIALLASGNLYYRETAQRLLSERANEETARKLIALIQKDSVSRKQKLHAIYAVAAMPGQLQALWPAVATVQDPVFQGWATRLKFIDPQVLPQAVLEAEAVPESILNAPLEVVVQKVIGSSKLQQDGLAVKILLTALQHPKCDVPLQQLVWQNLKRRIHANPNLVAELLLQNGGPLPAYQPILGRLLTVLVEMPSVNGPQIAELLIPILKSPAVSDTVKQECLTSLIAGARNAALRHDRLRDLVRLVNAESLTGESISPPLLILRALGGDDHARGELKNVVEDVAFSLDRRLAALQTLAAMNDREVIPSLSSILGDAAHDKGFRSAVIDAAGRINDPRISEILVSRYAVCEPDLQPRIIEVLTQRPVGSIALLNAIESGRIPKAMVNQNQLARMNSFKDEALKPLIAKHFGTIRSGVRQDRQGAIGRSRDFLNGTPGDPVLGAIVFKKTCAQCHKIYGEGADVGPDITRNGRNDWAQLLQNVLDPSAVIGPGYQARIVATEDGRVLTGLPIEDSPEQLVLKLQGGKLETIPKSQIEADRLSELSMMPDELEKTMTPQELADLFAFLALDQPPENPEAKLLPGAPAQRRRNP